MRTGSAIAALVVVSMCAGVAAEQGHFVEIDGTASIEVEEYLTRSGGSFVDTESPNKIPPPLSNGAMYVPCAARRNFDATWKVTFSQTGTYQVWILGWGNDNAADNFGVFLGRQPGSLRTMNATQNCSYNSNASCPNYEATLIKGGSSLGWSKNHQCIANRGCTGNTTTWTIEQAGTYYMGIHNGDEPFESHEYGCNNTSNEPVDPPPFMVIDKFVITKTGIIPTGQGPAATRMGAFASFTFSGVSAAPAEVQFDASSSTSSDGSTITSYAWDFGDGGSGSGEQTSHAYTANGVYSVTLTVGTSSGSSASTSKTVSIIDPAEFSIMVNAGAGAMHGFSADQVFDGQYGYEGGSAVAPQGTPVANTEFDDVFSSVRHQDFTYKIAVPAAQSYTVQLLFAEHWRNPGERVFKLDVEGDQTPNIDIAAEVGNAAAYTVTRTVTVSDGVLDITAVRVTDNPMISGVIVTAGSGAVAIALEAQAIMEQASTAQLRRVGNDVMATGLAAGDVVTLSTLQGRLVCAVTAASSSLRLPIESAGQILVARVLRHNSVCAHRVLAE